MSIQASSAGKFVCMCAYIYLVCVWWHTDRKMKYRRTFLLKPCWTPLKWCCISFCVVLFHWGSERGQSTVDQVPFLWREEKKNELKNVSVLPQSSLQCSITLVQGPLWRTQEIPQLWYQCKEPRQASQSLSATCSVSPCVLPLMRAVVFMLWSASGFFF